jgi:hypothetical protein
MGPEQRSKAAEVERMRRDKLDRARAGKQLKPGVWLGVVGG